MKRGIKIPYSRQTWSQLPYRQEVDSPEIGKYYRSKGDNFGVYLYKGVDGLKSWEPFAVRFVEVTK